MYRHVIASLQSYRVRGSLTEPFVLAGSLLENGIRQ
jgi:hypothetical protein